MRTVRTIQSGVKDLSREANPFRVSRGHLAEDYDGIGQYVLVTMSRGSTSNAYRARIASADFGTGQVIPVGTIVTLGVIRGKIEILSMGAK